MRKKKFGNFFRFGDKNLFLKFNFEKSKEFHIFSEKKFIV